VYNIKLCYKFDIEMLLVKRTCQNLKLPKYLCQIFVLILNVVEKVTITSIDFSAVVRDS